MADESKSGMLCGESEGLLAEALDGTLSSAELVAFEAHRQTCEACRTTFAEARAGIDWLSALDEVEPPRNLVHNILAQTIGQIPEPKPVVAPEGAGWVSRLKARLSPFFAPVATPRFAMSFGMAFFSITMLLGIAGFKMADLKRLDFSSKGLERAYYSTQARVIRYYENIRLVYEIESRVRDLRHAAAPQKQEGNPPQSPSNVAPEKKPQRRDQSYNRGNSRLLPAAATVDWQYQIAQARLNRRIA
jgi:hypothetical protein